MTMIKGEVEMASSEGKVGELVDIRPLGSKITSSERAVLLRAKQVEIARLVVADRKAASREARVRLRPVFGQ
jgi:hypothetical protein